MGLAQNVKALYRGAAPLGIRVLRPVNGADLDTQPATVNMFRVTGGDILLTSIYGIVTVEMAGVATTIRLSHTSTAVAYLCAAHATLTGDPVNTIYYITGTVGDAMNDTEETGIGISSLSAHLLILVPGILGLVVGGATNTGEIQWSLNYVPLEEYSAVEPIA